MKKLFIVLVCFFIYGCSVFSQKYIGGPGNVERQIKHALKTGSASNTYTYGYADCEHAQLPNADVLLFFEENSDKYELIAHQECGNSYYFDWAHRKILNFTFRVKNQSALGKDEQKILLQQNQKMNAVAKPVKKSRFALQMDNFLAYVEANSTPLEVNYRPGQEYLYNYQHNKVMKPDNTGYLPIKTTRTPKPDGKCNLIVEKELLLKYMLENNYYCEIVEAHNNYYGTVVEVTGFKFRKKAEVDDYFRRKADYEKGEKELKIEQEKTRVRNESKALLASYEEQYNKAVSEAKIKARAKSGWSVTEYPEGYYIGETRSGKREGYGEFYWKNIGPIEDKYEANISYLGYWSNDQYNGQGEKKYYYKTRTDGLWTAYTRYYCSIDANFVNGKAEGDGYFLEERTGLLAGRTRKDHVLYQNGGILRNFSEEERTAGRNEISLSDCFQLIEKTRVTYTDGYEKKAEGYKIRCTAPSKYTFESVIYFNTGGGRYQAGWYKDDGGIGLKDSYIGFKDDNYKQAGKKVCGCW